MISITTPRGGSSGKLFSDIMLAGDITTAAISEITIWLTGEFQGLQIKYSWDGGELKTEALHGLTTGTPKVLTLGDDEFIAGVEGYSSASFIEQLTFFTNKRKWGPCGSCKGQYFQWGNIIQNQGTQSPRKRLLAFAGRVDYGLQNLQGIFLDQPGPDSSGGSLNYEGIPAEVSGVSVAGTSLFPVSAFMSHLMSPAINLHIGPDRVEFHVPVDKLCKLPFFRAALKGGFQESLSQSIEMPDDDPRTLSALIEFLYTGNYTYAYGLNKAMLRETIGTPIGDLTEGEYHVGVFVIASKYDSPVLADMAVECFKAVLLDVDCVDKLRLWRTAYRQGPDLKGWRKALEECYAGKGLLAWVHELFEKHRDVIDQAISESPELAADLLCLATSSGGGD